MRKVSKWQKGYKCYVCLGDLSEYQVFNSKGCCPYCGVCSNSRIVEFSVYSYRYVWEGSIWKYYFGLLKPAKELKGQEVEEFCENLISRTANDIPNQTGSHSNAHPQEPTNKGVQ